MQHRFTVDVQRKQQQHRGDSDSLNSFNLESGVEVASIKQDSLRLLTGVVRGWIADISAFVDAGLFVKAGLSVNVSVRTELRRTSVNFGTLTVNDTRIDGFIADVDFAQRTLTTVASLPATFM